MMLGKGLDLVDAGALDGNRVIRVAIVEDSAMLRELIEDAVADAPEMRLVFSAANCRDAAEQIDWARVDFATLDLHLPDGLGLELGRRVRERYPRIRIAILSDHRRRSLLTSLTSEELPFWSYILKSSIDGRMHLSELLRQASHGAYIDPRIDVAGGPTEEAVNALSEQQRKILGLVARGLSNSAIAKQLCLSEKSVEYNLTQTYVALNLTGDSSANPRVSAAVLFLRRYAPDTHV
jgi:DNA-binding NarL/FixJ family response regulator